MSEKIVQLNEEIIKGQIKELVRGSVEETLNELLEKEAESLTQAARYERSEARQGYRSGHYDRNLTTTSGDVTLHVPRLKGVSFETAIIERYRRRESSVEEALIEMYLAGVSVRRVEDITEALWGSKVSPATISELNKKAYVHIEDWRNRPLQGGRYPYVYVDGIYLRRNWGGEHENVAVLVAIAVNEDGFREVLGAAEGMKEDKASWVSFFQWLRGRGLDGVKLIVGDKCMGMLEAVGEVFPDAKYQRCTVHFYRNVFSVVPKSKVKIVAKMLKAIHAQESKKASREKAKAVVAELRAMKLKEAAKKVEDGIEETLTYCDFPSEHWTRIRTNNGWELRTDAGLRPAPPCGGHPVGQQEIHEHEALGGGSGRRLHCRLTSFSRSLQINLRINLDGTTFERSKQTMSEKTIQLNEGVLSFLITYHSAPQPIPCVNSKIQIPLQEPRFWKSACCCEFFRCNRNSALNRSVIFTPDISP